MLDRLTTFFDEIVNKPYFEIRIIDPAKPNSDSTVDRKFASTSREAAEFALKPEFSKCHVFYGVCPRKEHSGKKTAIHSAWTIWADLDIPEIPQHTLALPPSYIVFTGHGHHLYWRLVRPEADQEAVEDALRYAQAFSQGDRVCDISRVMRVPGTYNVKDAEPAQCEIVTRTSALYELGDFKAISRVSPGVLERIRSGSTEGFESRSERDWSVICALVKAGVSDTAIRSIFAIEPIGDKVREESDDHYLEFTLRKARSNDDPNTGPTDADFGIFERPGEGYYRPVASGNDLRLSTFTLDLKAILISDGAAEESFQADVLGNNQRTPGIVFPRSCFLSVATLTKHLPSVQWQWLGSDKDVRYLLAYLAEQASKRSIPQKSFVRSLGLHKDLWVGSDSAFSTTEEFTAATAPITAVGAANNYVQTAYRIVDAKEYAKLLGALDRSLSKVNLPSVVVPMLGWYMATPYKTRLEDLGVRFPILNVFGTRGAGKTTIVQAVWLPLMGVTNPTVHDCNTTRFVMLSLLGATNAIPIALAEFRQSSLSIQQYNVILRTVLLAYDQGRDSRGRADQTVVDYPLCAPFSIDGEDPLPDQAAKERVLAVYMNPNSIAAETAASKALLELQAMDLSFFAANYIRWTLGQDPKALWNRASEAVNGAFPGHLPHRVRRNLTVTWLGVLSYRDFCETQGLKTSFPVDAALLQASLDQVVTLQGISRMAADEFVEDLINYYAVNGNVEFAYRFKPDEGVFWFHPKTAYDWWSARRTRERRSALDYRSIRHQLQERYSGPEGLPGAGQYVESILTVQRAPTFRLACGMTGINLDAARLAGLEIPDSLEIGETIDIS